MRAQRRSRSPGESWLNSPGADACVTMPMTGPASGRHQLLAPRRFVHHRLGDLEAGAAKGLLGIDQQIPLLAAVEHDAAEAARADDAMGDAAADHHQIARPHLVGAEFANIVGGAAELELEFVVAVAAVERELRAVGVVALDKEAVVAHRDRPWPFAARHLSENIEEPDLLHTASAGGAGQAGAVPLDERLVAGLVDPGVQALDD